MSEDGPSHHTLALDIARLQVSHERSERELMQMVAFVEASVERLSKKMDTVRDHENDFTVSIKGLEQSLNHIQKQMLVNHSEFRKELVVIKNMVESNTRFRQQLRAWTIGLAVGSGITGGGVAAGLVKLLG